MLLIQKTLLKNNFQRGNTLCFTLKQQLLRFSSRVKYHCNESIWDNGISSPEGAYAYGWVLTDGYIKQRRYSSNGKCISPRISISLKFNSYQSLLAIKNCVLSNSPISFGVKPSPFAKPGIVYVEFNFGKDQIVNSAIKLLGIERIIHKKCDVININKIREVLYNDSVLCSHFLRGIFEGDGCISFSYDCHRKNGFNAHILLSSTNKQFLCDIKRLINYHCFNTTNVGLVADSTSALNLVYGGSKCVKVICDFLYRDFKITDKYPLFHHPKYTRYKFLCDALHRPENNRKNMKLRIENFKVRERKNEDEILQYLKNIYNGTIQNEHEFHFRPSFHRIFD